MKLRTSYFLFAALVSVNMWAAAPAGYYSAAEGKTGAALKTALSNIVGTHTALSYDGLWTAFQTTDKRPDGKVWDIYSNTTNFTFITNQCTSYSGEGDCYNREHSFPKSWFSDATPMYTDLFHLYPSDGYVNGKRSNYPFGEVSSPTYTSNNGYSKLGPCSFPGYTDIVFEPNDELKGDMARTYFYMVTAYESKISAWTSEHLDGTTYPGFNTWSVALFRKWNTNDAVSTKETNRNDEIYTNYQHNRNPFIDHPELAEYIWGDKVGQPWYETAQTVTAPTLSTPTSANISTTTATLGGYISSLGNASITASGVEYSTTNGFVAGSGTTVNGSATTTGAFTVAVSGLTPATTYYYKAFATNSAGTGYTTQGSFTTATPSTTTPTIFTGSVVDTGTTLDFGTVTTSATKSLLIKTAYITGDLTVSVSGSMFSASTTSIPQANAESGYPLTVTYTPTAAGTHSGTLSITGGGLSGYSVSLTGKK